MELVRRTRRVLWIAPAVLMAGCAGTVDGSTEAPGTTGTVPVVEPAVATTTTAATSIPSSTVGPGAEPTTSAAVPTTSESTTTVPTDHVEFGRSLQGRPITATRRGTPGGTVVLVIGAIHGNEDAGIAVIDDLLDATIPDGIDLWLVESINPDGVANDQRGNANGVDLNRNFPHDWQPIAELGDWQYSGSGPASEPETQAIINLSNLIQPKLTVWYHQDLYRISPGTGLDGLIRARYAELTGLPLLRVTGGTYTGVAATWQRRTLPDAIAFIVELGETLSSDEAAVHAAAVLDVAQLLPPQP